MRVIIFFIVCLAAGCQEKSGEKPEQGTEQTPKCDRFGNCK